MKQNRNVCRICSRTAKRDGGYCGVHKSAKEFKPTSSKRKGWVYFIDLGFSINEKRYIKIGFSKKIDQRLKSLQASNPFCFVYDKIFVTHGAKRLEAYTQRQCERFYFEREVFLVPTNDLKLLIDHIKNIA